jgi:hypothetical protein
MLSRNLQLAPLMEKEYLAKFARNGTPTGIGFGESQAGRVYRGVGG